MDHAVPVVVWKGGSTAMLGWIKDGRGSWDVCINGSKALGAEGRRLNPLFKDALSPRE